MIRHLCIRVGPFMLENWHLYRLTRHHAVKDPKVNWLMWDRLL